MQKQSGKVAWFDKPAARPVILEIVSSLKRQLIGLLNEMPWFSN